MLIIIYNSPIIIFLNSSNYSKSLFMKKVLLSFALSVMLIASATIVAFAAHVYYYCFVLSCGYTIEQESPRELTSEELLQINDLLEEIYCGGGSNAEAPELM